MQINQGEGAIMYRDINTHRNAHGLAYQGHPVAAVVALANLKVLQGEGIVNRVKHGNAEYFQKCLRELFKGHPLVGEVQGAGAVASLQFARNKIGKNVLKRLNTS